MVGMALMSGQFPMLKKYGGYEGDPTDPNDIMKEAILQASEDFDKAAHPAHRRHLRRVRRVSLKRIWFPHLTAEESAKQMLEEEAPLRAVRDAKIKAAEDAYRATL